MTIDERLDVIEEKLDACLALLEKVIVYDQSVATMTTGSLASDVWLRRYRYLDKNYQGPV